MKYEKTMNRLREHCVDNVKNLVLENVVMIARKHTSVDNDEHFDCPFYIASIQRRPAATKRRWLQEKIPISQEIVVIDNPNRVNTFNRFAEEDNIER